MNLAQSARQCTSATSQRSAAAPSSPSSAARLCIAFKHQRHVKLPDIHAQYFAAIDHVLPIDAGGEGFVLPFPADAPDFDIADILARPHQRHCRDQAGQLIDRVKRLVAQGHAVISRQRTVTQDRADVFFAQAALAQIGAPSIGCCSSDG